MCSTIKGKPSLMDKKNIRNEKSNSKNTCFARWLHSSSRRGRGGLDLPYIRRSAKSMGSRNAVAGGNAYYGTGALSRNGRVLANRILRTRRTDELNTKGRFLQNS